MPDRSARKRSTLNRPPADLIDGDSPLSRVKREVAAQDPAKVSQLGRIAGISADKIRRLGSSDAALRSYAEIAAEFTAKRDAARAAEQAAHREIYQASVAPSRGLLVLEQVAAGTRAVEAAVTSLYDQVVVSAETAGRQELSTNRIIEELKRSRRSSDRLQMLLIVLTVAIALLTAALLYRELVR